MWSRHVGQGKTRSLGVCFKYAGDHTSPVLALRGLGRVEKGEEVNILSQRTLDGRDNHSTVLY
jgi:hypothetical protein